jgi:polar amino acid transport system substrate-binding protein
MDIALALRTMVIPTGAWRPGAAWNVHLQAGAGVVLDSVPEAEYEETVAKSAALGRAIAFGWMIGGIVLVAAFTSALTATMTAERVTGAIHGPRDLAGRTVGCQAGAVTVPLVRQRGGITQEFQSIHEALDALQLGMVEAVVADNQQLMFLTSQANRQDVRLVGPIFESFDYGIALSAGSPLREDLNTAILRMREDDTLDRIKDAWLGKHD